MQVVDLNIAERQAAIEFTRWELAVINNALNEVCNGIPVVDLSAHVVGLRDRARALLRKAHRILETCSVDEVVVVFPRDELRVAREALDEVRKRISEWEFHARLGAELDEAGELRDQVRRAIDCIGRGRR